jgi:hypothetical protein
MMWCRPSAYVSTTTVNQQRGDGGGVNCHRRSNEEEPRLHTPTARDGDLFTIFMSYIHVHQLPHILDLLSHTVCFPSANLLFLLHRDCSLTISTMRFSTSITTALFLANANSVALAFTPSRITTSTRTSSSSSSSSLSATSPRTLYDKIWDDHLVDDDGQSSLLYIDRHLVHEVTSPQAFEGLRLANRSVRRPDCTLCTVDHNVPTTDRSALLDVASFITETASRTQVVQMTQNMVDFNLPYFGIEDERQGIVHIIGPEQGFTLPGCTTVCGDSHTATHGAFGALAFGIGTSEVEHVLATQVSKEVK